MFSSKKSRLLGCEYGRYHPVLRFSHLHCMVYDRGIMTFDGLRNVERYCMVRFERSNDSWLVTRPMAALVYICMDLRIGC